MANLRQRLTALVENEHLAPSRREFAESLLRYYNTSKRLTAGRRPWVDRLEQEAIENAANPTEDGEILSEINKVLSNIVDTSSWDCGFAESIKKQVEVGSTLSPRQRDLFNELKERHSDEARREYEAWILEYREHHREDTIIVARYYDTTPYWTSQVRRILKDPDYVPAKGLFNKMVKNKYAQKVLSETYREPKYAPGTSVIPRAGRAVRPMRNGGVILKVLPEVFNAANGTKRYLILPYGAIEPMEWEERHIKELRRPKKKKA